MLLDPAPFYENAKLTRYQRAKMRCPVPKVVDSTPSELETLKKENDQLRRRIYEFEHELGLKKGYR